MPRHLIHAVGPRWEGGKRGESELLNDCYKNIFRIVTKNNLGSVALPAINTGVFGYPIEETTKFLWQRRRILTASTVLSL
ncbi:MAG: macro domain-containing protein [Alphaproteobacteria bacterium]